MIADLIIIMVWVIGISILMHYSYTEFLRRKKDDSF